jgi:hypothetical protein
MSSSSNSVEYLPSFVLHHYGIEAINNLAYLDVQVVVNTGSQVSCHLEPTFVMRIDSEHLISSRCLILVHFASETLKIQES